MSRSPRGRPGGGGRGGAKGVSRAPKPDDTSSRQPRKKKSDFPSARQRSCAGLNRRFYAAYQRDLVDFDYDAKLPQEAREWLAAFAEEYYRGWRLTNETQLHALPALREADAARSRARRALKGIGEGGARLLMFGQAENIDRLNPQTLTPAAPNEGDLVAAIDRHTERLERELTQLENVHSTNTRSNT